MSELDDLRRRLDDLRRELDALGRREVAGDLTGVVGAAIHAASAKSTPVDADTMPLIDSAASNVLKKVTWANIKATLKSYLDTLYVALTGDQTVSGIKTFPDRIDADTLRARDSNGVRIEDDAGGLGVLLSDGGRVGIGGAAEAGTNFHVYGSGAGQGGVTVVSFAAAGTGGGTGLMTGINRGAYILYYIASTGGSNRTNSVRLDVNTSEVFVLDGDTFTLFNFFTGQLLVQRTAGTTHTLYGTMLIVWY